MEERAIELLNELIKVYNEMDICNAPLMYLRQDMQIRLDPTLPRMQFN